MRAPDLDVVVLGGGGHVGLPLSLAFAESGLRVGDLRHERRRRWSGSGAGRCPSARAAPTPCSREVLPTGRLVLRPIPPMVGRAEALVVVIGTPVDEFLGPSMTLFEKTVEQVAPHLRDGALVVLRSTVYPGTTAYVAQAFADRGRRVDVAFCPERIAEGHALEEFRTLPQIVGADDPAVGDRAAALFARLGGEILRTTSKEAELAKLFTNTWRYMKFAIANQFFMVAHQAGVDYANVLDAIRRDYPRAADLPGPGFAAGPCLFKDTMQLAAFTSDHFPMGQSAMQVNEGMPAYVVSALERRHGTLRGRTVGILGMAFKAESDDNRGVAQLQAPQAPRLGGRARPLHGPVRAGRPPGAPRDGARGGRHAGPGRPPPRLPGPRPRRPRGRRRLGRAGPRDRPLMRVLVTGAAGFINGYLVPELLEAGHEVVGLDNFSKYGPTRRSYDDHPRYRLVEGDAKDLPLLRDLIRGCDQVVAAAAMIGGISYFHEFAYDLLAENERILAATFDAAIEAHRRGELRRIVVLSSSMVYESTTVFPTPEGAQLDLAAARLHLRLPEAGVRVLRQGRLGAAPASRTRSCARSTAWGSASAAPSATPTS